MDNLESISPTPVFHQLSAMTVVKTLSLRSAETLAQPGFAIGVLLSEFPMLMQLKYFPI